MEANAKRAARAEDMIRAYGTPLLRLCAACLGDVSLAEDAVQDTFLKAYRHLDAFSAQGAEAEKAWLCRIAVNTCRDYLRSAWMRRTVRGESAAALIDRAAAPEDIGLTEAIFSPMRALSREDFPALVWPASVTKTDFVMRQYPPAGW